VKTGFTGMPSGVSQAGASGEAGRAAGGLLTVGCRGTFAKLGIEDIAGD
jgi:hypothetical protein